MCRLLVQQWVVPTLEYPTVRIRRRPAALGVQDGFDVAAPESLADFELLAQHLDGAGALTCRMKLMRPAAVGSRSSGTVKRSGSCCSL